MPFLNFDEADAKPVETWDSLQHNLAESDIGFDDSPTITKTAGSSEQTNRALTDTTWAGSGTINEQYELERQVQELVDEGRVFPAIEKSLIAYGYHKDKIRRVFEKLTGVNPVLAYLDTASYTIPPDAVPRYNYGWGPSKSKDEDYYFVLPYTDKYAIYCQRGLNRSIVFQHLSLQAAQDELKKYAKDVRAVTPDVLDKDSDIIQRVASINVPSFENPEAIKLASEIHRLKLLDEPDLAKKMVADAVQDGKITIAEQVQLYVLADAADPSEMSGQEQERQKSLDKYKTEQEGTSLEDEVNTLKLPGDDFQNFMETDNKVDMKELSSDAYDLLREISDSIPGFSIEPVGSRVDLMDVEGYTSDPSNHIDTGSIRFLVNIVDSQSQQELKGLVIMFIINGKLQYSGKFKGGDNREYALSTPGLNAYFDAVEGKSVEDLHYSPQAIPQSESTSPYK